ncbi:MAG: sn-glycerol-1-phosphate dehydrogenase, partial [Alistipes sp.]|nr:sn-glycerol-1-phosphate dehydrogenase [Alistipes sp.]
KCIFAGNAGLTARALEETRNKYVDKEGLRKQLTAVKESWGTLKERIRAQIIPFDEVYANLKAVGAPYEPEMIGVSRERFRKTFTYMPYMRSRITAIDLLFRCGMVNEVEEHLFGKGGHWEVA